MSAFDWIAAGFVILTMLYLSFFLTLREWFAALRRGEAVTLLPEREGRSLPIWTQGVTMLAGLVIAVLFFHYLWIPVLDIPRPIAQVLPVVGLILYSLGFALLMSARRTLGKYWGISTSRQARLLPDHELIRRGPYAVVRHPMYLGGWVLLLGLALLYPVWAMLLMFIFGLISFSNRARREEAVLASKFGDEWTAYKSHTRMYIPFLW